MMRKMYLLAAVLLILLFSFCTVFADQIGNKCWCNIDQSGCWITGETGGKIYIMFWTEEARRSIMGSISAPYKLVVSHPGFSGTLPLECGSGSSSGGAFNCEACYAECDRMDCGIKNCQGCYEKCSSMCPAPVDDKK